MRKALKRKNRRTIPIALILLSFILVQSNSTLYASPFVLPHESLAQYTESGADGGSGGILPGEKAEGEFVLVDGRVVYIDREALAFAVFSSSGSFDIPILVGKIETDGNSVTLVPNLEIEQYQDLYVVKNLFDSYSLQVVERLGAGGFGRILRYRGMAVDGKKRDLEFIYQDRENRVTILDHLAGKFYKTSFKERQFDPLSAFPKEDKNRFLGELLATVGGDAAKFLHSKALLALYHPSIQLLHTQSEVLHKQEIWARRHVRGPPIEEALS